MNKKNLLLLTAIGLLLGACGTQKQTITDNTPPPPDNSRKPVPGLSSILSLHPVDNAANGENGKKYDFMYDYAKKYLYFTDVDSTYAQVRNFLPEYITKDSIGHGVTLETVSAHPFSNFTDETKKRIAQSEGLKFDAINDYRIAKAFNVKYETSSVPAMQALLKMLQNDTTANNGDSGARLSVNGAQGMLLLHPIRNAIKDVHGAEWYFFYDLTNHYIFITDSVSVYEKFQKGLPAKDNINAVLVQGISIDPFVYFDQQAIDAMTKDEGLEINGGDQKHDINKFDVATIASYGIVFDYKTVIKALQEKLGTRQSSTASSFEPKTVNHPSGDQNIKPFPKVTAPTVTPPVQKKSTKKQNDSYDPNAIP